MIGAMLGLVGSAFQALFRNPLAEPYTVGVSSGAAVGGTTALVAGLAGLWGGLGTFAFAFAGAMLTLMLVVMVARRGGIVDTRSLLLAGVAVGALLAALLSLMLLLAGQDTNAVLSWLLGNLGNLSWPKVGLLFLVATVGSGLLLRKARSINSLSLGTEAAQHLGVDAGVLSRQILVTGSVLVAAATGAAGIIAFLGLVAPHLARLVFGVDWRRSMAGSLLLGSVLLLSADLVAQRVFSLVTGTVGMDIPVGVVTALLGAPSLLILVRKAA